MRPRLFPALLLPAALALGLAALPAAEPESVTIKPSDTDLTFRAGDDLVSRYVIGPDVGKPYLWPVHGPGDVNMTRTWPVDTSIPNHSTDHPHQKSAWFCHGDVIPEGMTLEPGEKDRTAAGIDFWSDSDTGSGAKGHGVIACTKVEDPKTDKNHAQVTTQNQWRTALGRKVMDETRTIHLYDFGDTRLFVFDIDLHASVVPITFGDTKEGSFGIRINDTIREEIVVNKKKMKGPGKLENAEGKVGEKECWGYPSAWCDYSGPIDGKEVGLAILTDPSNAYPSCWHSRGYGLMAANPFGREKSGFPSMKGRTDLVKMAKGEHLKFRFGILIHPGDAKGGKVAEYYDRFVKLKG